MTIKFFVQKVGLKKKSGVCFLVHLKTFLTKGKIKISERKKTFLFLMIAQYDTKVLCSVGST